MTKKLEELLNLPENQEIVKSEEKNNRKAEKQLARDNAPAENLFRDISEIDKIAAALPQVKGLGDMSDAELDGLASKAEKAYDDLMDLGMNVEARYGSRMFEVAAQMMNAAITAKTNKIDKKLKMVDLQLKKLAIDRKNGDGNGNTVEAEAVIVTDRNSILAKLKNLNK
jgi:hypothetical protein